MREPPDCFPSIEEGAHATERLATSGFPSAVWRPGFLLLKEQGLPTPKENSDPKIIIQNEEKLARAS
jgi:hypothetical protein